MSLAEAFKDGREFRRLLSGGYEEDLRHAREAKEADIAYKNQLTESSKQNIEISKKREERLNNNKNLDRVLTHVAEPALKDIRNRGGTQADVDEFSDKFYEDYGDLTPGIGKIHFQKGSDKKELNYRVALPVKQEDLEKLGFKPGTVEHNAMAAQIKNSGGTHKFFFNGGPNGLDISSMLAVTIESQLKQKGVDADDYTELADLVTTIANVDTGGKGTKDKRGFWDGAVDNVVNIFKGASSGYPVEQKPPQSQDSDSLPTAVKYNNNTQQIKLSTGERISVADYEKGVDEGKYQVAKELTGDPVVKSVQERSKVGNGV